MSLRARQVDARRNRILDAAALLIRSTGGTDFSMRTLAEAAEVSPATPYNLFTSKDGLLYALLSRSLDEITLHGLAFRSNDPLERVLEAAVQATDIFLHDPDFLRPLYQFLLGVVDPIHRPKFIARSLAYWRSALASAEAEKLLTVDFTADMLVYTLLAHFMGVLEFWIHDDIDAAGFKARVVHDTVWLLLPLADEARKPRLLRRLREARRVLGNGNKLNAAIPIDTPLQRKKDPRK
jgi:AcrR family transcriptional regulator